MRFDPNSSPIAVSHECVTPDGTVLRGRVCRAATNTGTSRWIIWIHGIGEHGGRYDHVLQRWSARGWHVALMDLRGHGLSDGVRTDCHHIDDYLADLQAIGRSLNVTWPRAVLLGHSFGGLVAVRAVQSAQFPVSAVVLSSPLLGIAIPVPRWKIWLGRCLLPFAPTTRFATTIDDHNMTRSPEFLARRQADPWMQRSVTARWFFAMRAALEAAHKEPDRFHLPVLLLHGLADETTSHAASRGWLERIATTDQQLIELSDHRHELLNETDWETTADRIVDWAAAR